MIHISSDFKDASHSSPYAAAAALLHSFALSGHLHSRPSELLRMLWCSQRIQAILNIHAITTQAIAVPAGGPSGGGDPEAGRIAPFLLRGHS